MKLFARKHYLPWFKRKKRAAKAKPTEYIMQMRDRLWMAGFKMGDNPAVWAGNVPGVNGGEK